MTTATFETQGERLEKVTLSGHADLAPAGQDILCAALTSAMRLLECAVNEVMGLGAKVKVDEGRALLSLRLPAELGAVEEAAAQALLAGLMVYLSELSEEYPDHLTVLNREA